MNLKLCEKTLQKRLAHLRKRVAESDRDLTFDKQEASALEYALKVLSVTAVAATDDTTLALARTELAPRFAERLMLETIRQRLLSRDFHGWLKSNRVALIQQIEKVLGRTGAA